MARLLMWVILFVITVYALWGLLQLHGYMKSYNNLFAISGSFFNPGPYAGFLACGVPLALHSVLKGNNRAEKILGIVCLVSVGLVIPATMSRAAWLAVVAGSVPVILLQSKIIPLNIIQKSKNVTIVIFVSIAIFACVLYGLYSFKKNSADGRLLIWQVSAGLVSDKPLAGSGLGSFQALYDGAQADYFGSPVKVVGLLYKS